MMQYIQAVCSMYNNLLEVLFRSKNRLDYKCDRPSDIYTDEKDKQFRGVVTYLNNGFGLINDNVKFDSTEFNNIIIGSRVKAIAHKEYTDWKVISLEMDQICDVEQKNKVNAKKEENWDEETKKSNLNIEEEYEKYNSLNINDDKLFNDRYPLDDCTPHRAIVAEICNDILWTNNEDQFNIGTCEIDYPPEKGDMIIIWYLVDWKPGNTIKAKRIDYVRSKTFLSEVTATYRNGYVFDHKIFCSASLYEPASLSNNKKCFVEAVESNCDYGCNWRVVSVTPDNGSSYSQPFEFLPINTNDKPIMNTEDLPQLPEPQQNLESSNEVEFDVLEEIKLDNLYNARVLPLTLKFNLESPIILKNISTQSTSEIEQLVLDESYTDTHLFPLTIDGVTDHTFILNCTAKIMGASIEKIIISFDRMSAFKNINIMVGSTNTDTNAEHLMVIKGVKPFIPRRFLPKKLPAAEIPLELVVAVELNDLRSYLSILKAPLTGENYLNKLRILLYLEELQKKDIYRSYTLYKTCFIIENEYLALHLPWLDINSPLIIGDRVHVFALDQSYQISNPDSHYYEGFIHIIEGQKIYIKFERNEYNYLKYAACRVEFICSRTPFRKCHMGLSLVQENFGRTNLFPTCLPPESPPQASYIEIDYAVVRNPLDTIPNDNLPVLEWINPYLNAEQKTAIRSILVGASRPLPYIIFGPPGTGKTITMVEAISQIFLLVPHSRILVVTPSNSASDLIVTRLVESCVFDTLQLSRLNGFNRGKQTLPAVIKNFCWDVSQSQDMIDCRVIVCTTITAASLYEEGIASDHFTHVFLDEAGQMTEAESSIALGFVNKAEGQVILAGDPKQLGPVVLSPIAKKFGYGVSMLHRLYNSPLYSPDYTEVLKQNKQLEANSKIVMELSSMFDSRLITLLVRNYRSNAQLIHLSSLLFYKNALIAPEFREEDKIYRQWRALPNKNFPIMFYGMQGICKDSGYGSKENVMEATIVAEFVRSLLDHGICLKDIGVITPYRKQIKVIIHQFLKLRIGNEIDVGTVEKFQGQERAVIIISTVRAYSPNADSNSAYSIGFVSSPERFNVAITRAKSLLIVVGDPTVLELNYHWRALISYCHCNGALIDTRWQARSKVSRGKQ